MERPLMELTRGVVALLSGSYSHDNANTRDIELAMFLELFHPEMSKDQKREVRQAAKETTDAS